MLKPLLAGLMLVSLSATADYNNQTKYEVSITNITPGQTFTPQLVVTHPNKIRLFTVGEPASEALAIMAEGGNTAPLTDLVAGKAFDATTIGGLLGPGETATVTVTGPRRGGKISVAAMMIPTNDTFMALNSISLPRHGTRTRFVPAYDAGTEANDQSCQNMPGPRCGGEGHSPEPAEGDEGFVHIGNGFHELGDYDSNGSELLSPKVYDWRNSVAKITVKRTQ